MFIYFKTSIIFNFVKILFLGQKNSRPKNNLKPAFKNQCITVKKIWYNKNYKDFGIERIIRLILSLSLFIFPGLYIRHFFGKFGLLSRKIGVELYVTFKLILPILILYLNETNNIIVVLISSYLAIETILYLTSLIYLSNEFANPISYRRSITTLFINYFEISLNFAVIYSYCNRTIPDFFNKKLTNNIECIYFSFVTSATVGYGDIFITNKYGQILIIAQIIIFIIFIALFINFFTSKVNEPSYYNSNQKNTNKWPKSKN